MMNKMTDKSFIIAEVGQAHDGSLGNAHAYIDLAKKTGADAVKFQMHIADIESGPDETWRLKFSYQDDTRYDYWKRMEFNCEQWFELKSHCDKVGIEFICSAFSQTAALRLAEMGMKKFKVASGEIDNLLFISLLNRISNEIFISTGLSSENSISKCLNLIDNSQDRVSVMHCTTEYPTPLQNVGLSNLTKIRENHIVKNVGFSDHSGNFAVNLLAYSYGARVFESHICFHKSQFGPDTSASLDPETFKRMVNALRDFEILSDYEHGSVDKKIQADNRIRFGKTLTYSSKLKKGTVLLFEHLETRKPAGLGVSPSEYQMLIGKNLTQDVFDGQFVQHEHFE